MTKTTFLTYKKTSSFLPFILFIIIIFIYLIPTTIQITYNNKNTKIAITDETKKYYSLVDKQQQQQQQQQKRVNNSTKHKIYGETKSLLNNNLTKKQHFFINIKNKRIMKDDFNNIFIQEKQQSYDELNQYNIKNTLKLTIGYSINNTTRNHTKSHKNLKKQQNITNDNHETTTSDWSKLQKYVILNEKNAQTTEKIHDEDLEGPKLFLNTQIDKLLDNTDKQKQHSQDDENDEFEGSKLFINSKIEKNLDGNIQSSTVKTTQKQYSNVITKATTVKSKITYDENDELDRSKLFINTKIEKLSDDNHKVVSSTSKNTQKKQSDIDGIDDFEGSKLFINSKIEKFLDKNITSTTLQTTQKQNSNVVSKTTTVTSRITHGELDEKDRSKLFINKKIAKFLDETDNIFPTTLKTTPKQDSDELEEVKGSKLFINEKIEKIFEETGQIVSTTLKAATKDIDEFEGSKLFINKQIEKFLDTTTAKTTTSILKNKDEEGSKTFLNKKFEKISQNTTINENIKIPKLLNVTSSNLDDFEGSKLFINKQISKLNNSNVNVNLEPLKNMTFSKSETDFEGTKLFINRKIENYLEPTKKFINETIERVGFDGSQKYVIKLKSETLTTTSVPKNDDSKDIDGSKTFLSKNIRKYDDLDESSTFDLDYISDESVNRSYDNQIYEMTTTGRVGFGGAPKYNPKNILYQAKNFSHNETEKVGFVGSQKILMPTKYEHHVNTTSNETPHGFEGSQKIKSNDFDTNNGVTNHLAPFYTPRSISGKYLTSNQNFEETFGSEENTNFSTLTTEKSKPLPKSPSIISRKQYGRRRPSFNSNNFQTKVVGHAEQEEHIVSLLGLFELSTRSGDRPEGKSELAAAKLAVKHINKLNLLPGYTLELLTNDTKCDPGVGVDRFFHALYTQRDTRMVMLLGSACSEVTESLAKVVPYWNIVQISFGSTSPVLSDRSEFPLFYRTVAPDSSHNPARIAFVRKFGWDTVTALSQNEDIYSLAINDLVTELERSNITCTATITFAVTDFKDQMKMLRDLDTRIIIGSFSYKIAPKIFCEAYKLGMYGADYAWILQGGPSDAWWTNTSSLIGTTDCTPQELAEATEGLILVSSHNSIVGTDPSLSGLTNEMFASELEALDVTMSRYAPQTYDAVWAMALALQGAEQHWQQSEGTSVAHFDYTRKDMADEFLEQLASLNFSGISGPVSFSGSDRVGTSAFHQVQGGEINTVALFYPASKELDFDCVRCVELQWAGGQVPIAKRVFKLRVVTIAPAAFLAISSLAIIGITLAIGFLIFNLHFRRLKSIKLSSPRLNNMAAVGCILVYTAVILLGLDHATLQDNDHFSTVCTARVYLLSAGFSLAFGSMFTKTYRVHHIFTHSISRRNAGIVKNKLLQDTQLILMICVLLLMDCFIVTLWVIVDPMQRHLRNLTLEISLIDRSVVYQPQVEVCISQNTNGWLGALYAYKGLLLIVGVYMAWETRHVKIPALNDSEYIGMSVYSVVITSGIVVVLANLMSEQATLAFVTITMLILISTTSTLCLLFLPKLHAILGDEENADPVVESMGLKIEYNTRRFVTDDRRELQYRVEVQNRVYRREVAALDLEIGRLEKLLLESVSTSTSSSSSSTSSLTHSKFNKNHHQPEVSIIDELTPNISDGGPPIHPRTPSIGGGLPLLLLSVLPPVIPRASWPSADRYTNRRSVTFSSEPKLDDSKTCIHHEPVIDLLNLRIRHDPSMLGIHNEKPSMLERIKNFFGSRPSLRKTSTASFGNANTGIAAALKVHMGYIAGLVPNRAPSMATSSCNTSSLVIDQLSKRHSTHGQCSSGPTIDITSSSDDRKLSLALCFPNKNQENTNSSEPHVNFDLNPQRKMSTIIHQQSQPILSFRERAKGSPRFPHKIVPTCSLTALEDRRKNSGSGQISGSNSRRCSHQPPAKNNQKLTNNPGPPSLVGKWRSMEDATFSLPQGMRRGSGALGASCLPLSAGFQPRASSYSPNCDVWATAEFGIPLSEFNSSGKKRSETNNDKQNPENNNN